MDLNGCQQRLHFACQLTQGKCSLWVYNRGGWGGGLVVQVYGVIIGEFTCNGPFDPSVHLTSKDITLVPYSHSPSHMLVHLKQSKTDPFSQGHTITIAKSSSPICSVMAMKDYLLQTQPPSSQPLFAFVQPRQWLTRNNLTTELRTILQHCGLPANNFYSHSFRIGAATTAAKAGLPPWLIQPSKLRPL